jgi:hypothetical protein
MLAGLTLRIAVDDTVCIQQHIKPIITKMGEYLQYGCDTEYTINMCKIKMLHHLKLNSVRILTSIKNLSTIY